jgi:hypothetical protein
MENITVSSTEPSDDNLWKAFLIESNQYLQIERTQGLETDSFYVQLSAIDGRVLINKHYTGGELTYKIPLPDLPSGNYAVSVIFKNKPIWSKSLFIAP